MAGNLYPKILESLEYCCYVDLPFLHNALIGDLFWIEVIFGLARVAEFGRRAGFRFQ
jgi:hypothetical protein